MEIVRLLGLKAVLFDHTQSISMYFIASMFGDSKIPLYRVCNPGNSRSNTQKVFRL